MHAELVYAVVAFAPYFQSRGFYVQAEQYLQHTEYAATVINDQHSLSTILLYKGQVFRQQGKFTEPEAIFQQGLVPPQQSNNQEQISAFLNDLGWVTWKIGNYSQAEAYLQEGLSIARKLATRNASGIP